MRRRGRGEKWLWMENPDRRIYRRQHDGFLWILHDLNTGGGPSRGTWSHWWLLICKPDLEGDAASSKEESSYLFKRGPCFSFNLPPSSSFISPNLIVNQNTVHSQRHMINRMKNVCEKKKLVMANTLNLSVSIYNKQVWLRPNSQPWPHRVGTPHQGRCAK